MGIQADRVFVTLEADDSRFGPRINRAAAEFDRNMSAVEHAASRAEGSIRGSMTVIGDATAQAAYRSRLLGYQISDIGTQLASGTSPFIVLAQQAPQVANALEGTQGVAGRLAAFFSGPWGAALLAAASVVGVLAGKLNEASGASEKKEDATESLVTSIEKLNEVTGLNNKTEQVAIALAVEDARKKYLQVIASREKTKALLDEAAATEAVTRARSQAPGERGEIASLGLPSASSRLSYYQDQIAAQNNAIRQAERGLRGARANSILSQVQGKSEPQVAAMRVYENEVYRLRQSFAAGAISEKSFEQGIVSATRAREAATASVSRHTTAVRSHATATRGATTVEKDLTSELDAIQKRFDPAAAAAREFAKTIDTIDALQARGLLKATDAIAYKLQLGFQQAAQLLDHYEAFYKEKGIDPNRDLQDIVKNITGNRDADRDVANESARKAEDVLQQQRERNIRDLAFLYEDLFTGGIDSVWKTFKREGIRAIASLLAEKTIGSLGGGSSGGIFGSLFGSLFGRASGGYVGPGQTVRVNEQRGGVELLRMGPQGGSIVPLGQMSASPRQAAQQPVVIQITADEGAMFVPRVQQISGDVSIVTVRQTAPAIVKASVDTMREAARPRL